VIFLFFFLLVSIKTFKSIHDKEILLVNNYEYMFDKKRQRIRDQKNIYYWKCTKRCGEKRSKARQEMIQDPTPEIVERYQDLRKIASKKIRNAKR